MQGRQSTIELSKEGMKFSAAHFTILSATERENLHGHNFTIRVDLTGDVDDNGMISDYGPLKRLVQGLCDEWNETLLLPSLSPHLRLEQTPTEVLARFRNETLRFLPRDVTVLPVSNITIEELSRLFGERLAASDGLVGKGVTGLVVRCASGPGQWSTWAWQPDGP
jgi:6-pyruvoyltetrahydropterin/6-carboxytetrahydropterin synthase